MFFDQRYTSLGLLRNALSMVVLPIQKLVDWPIQWSHQLSDGVASHKTLLKENQSLREELLRLQLQIQQLNLLQQENIQLRAFLKSPPHLHATHTMVAQLLGINSDPVMQEFVLDKGSNDGVTTGIPVVDAQGVVGQIIQVNPYTSRVMLVTDSRSIVPIQNVRNNVRGLIAGTGDPHQLNLINMPITADVKVGDVLITSGLGGRYPAGAPVGIVTEVLTKPGDQFLLIKVKPSAALDSVRQVLLVWINSSHDHAA